MTPETNEWSWTSQIKSWIDGLLLVSPGLPFSRADVEIPTQDASGRRDLTIRGADGTPVLTGEIKLPYGRDGGSPYNETVVQDALSKARDAAVTHFFTWNVNEFVLWETFDAGTPLADRKHRAYLVLDAPVLTETDLLLPDREEALEDWLLSFLAEYALILVGEDALTQKAPDETFVRALESALRLPVLFSYAELQSRYQTPTFRSDLDAWMRDSQGWVISEDADAARDFLLNASKFACYVLVNRLVFYEVKRAG